MKYFMNVAKSSAMVGVVCPLIQPKVSNDVRELPTAPPSGTINKGSMVGTL